MLEVVQRIMSARGMHVRRLGPDSWLVERGRRLRYRPLGSGRDRGTVLVDDRRLRRSGGSVQRDLFTLLGDNQVGRVLRELEVNCVLDVGANAGQFARRLRKQGYRGRIVSFEPVREFLVELEKSAADDPDWHVYPVALGEENASAEINATPGRRLSSLLPATEFGKDKFDPLASPEKQEIEVRRLDSLFDEAVAGLDDARVYLKLDTQGFDLPAFRGAGDRVEDILAMQSEVACVPIYDGMPRLPEQLDAYESAGFEIAGMFPVTHHAATMRVIEFDMVMVRPEAVAASRGTA